MIDNEFLKLPYSVSEDKDTNFIGQQAVSAAIIRPNRLKTGCGGCSYGRENLAKPVGRRGEMWAVVLFFRRELHRVEVWAPNDGVGDGCWVILRMVAVATGREERKTVQRGEGGYVVGAVRWRQRAVVLCRLARILFR